MVTDSFVYSQGPHVDSMNLSLESSQVRSRVRKQTNVHTLTGTDPGRTDTAADLKKKYIALSASLPSGLNNKKS